MIRWMRRNDLCHCGSGKKYKKCHGAAAPAAVEPTELKTSSAIRRILTEEFGFTDLDAYKKWIADVRPRISPSRELIEKLSPDNIDCTDFWKVCEELFGNDPVFNEVIRPEVGNLPYAIESRVDANRMNLLLAKSLGVTTFLDECADRRLKVLEIGPGFGSLKNYIETHTRYIYAGVDVYPRIEGVLQATPEGVIPDDFLEKERGLYSYVVSSNVFQHLSTRQRSKYFRDSRLLLHKEGLFIFNVLVDTAKLAQRTRDHDGNAWCDHYGQFTEIPRAGALHDELSTMFRILYVTQRYDGIFNFVCQCPS